MKLTPPWLRFITTVALLAATGLYAAEPAAETVSAKGAYHVGRLKFESANKETLELLVNFRAGQGVANMLLVGGGYYSPPVTGQYGMNPLVDLANVTGLRFDGGKLTGELKWQPPRGPLETIALQGIVVDGAVRGTAGAGPLTGWLRDGAEMSKHNGFAPGKDWTSWTGSAGDWTGADADRALVAEPQDRRLVWFSEASFGAGRDGRRDPIRYVSGYGSPILGAGRLFVLHQEPVGGIVDDAVVAELNNWKFEARGDLDPVVVAGRERGSQPMARVEAQDVVFGVDAASGATLWKTTLPAPSFMPTPYNKHCDDNRTGCFADGKLFVLGRTARLCCLDGATGRLLWDVPVPKWHAALEKSRQDAIAARKLVTPPSHYPPLFHADGVVFGAFPSDGLVAFEAASGKLLWSSTGTPWQPFGAARWDHDGRSDIVFTGPKGLTCADPKTGRIVWEKPIDGSPVGSLELRLLGSHVICGARAGKDAPQVTHGYLLDKDGPRKLWTITDEEQYLLWPMHAAAARNGVAYIRYMLNASGAVKSKVVAVELATGKPLARQEFLGTFIGMIEVSNGWVLVHEDGCHSGSTFTVHTERDLKKVGVFHPTHVSTSSYDSPMAYPFVDGRLILRGRNRLYCYDLRKDMEPARD